MNIAVAQSGGPTCAINASLVGVFSEALKEPSIDAIFGSINGIEGMIDDHLIDLKTMIRTNEDMEMLLQTPSTVLGSCRYKLKDWHDDDTAYQKIIHCFEQRQIGAFFYIGGNDSMDTVEKLSRYIAENNIDIISQCNISSTIICKEIFPRKRFICSFPTNPFTFSGVEIPFRLYTIASNTLFFNCIS